MKKILGVMAAGTETRGKVPLSELCGLSVEGSCGGDK